MQDGNPELLKLAEAIERRASFLEMKFKDPILDVTRHNLDELSSGNRVLLLFFTAEWCGPCISYLATYRDLAREISKPGVVFGKVDVDRAADIADRYNIDHIPSIAVIVNGKLVDVIIGSTSKEKLKARIEPYLHA
ncbi:MAG: thioredoxin family protein [Desulfurococcales archaeon]|nr:thioredoxin family protein [Desulfurococcales archaeon]